MNWQSFNIAAGETTIFNQPSASSIVWNRINDTNPSQIYGSLQANGVVVLLNSSGFYFGPNSFVSTAGLVVSTANCLPPQNAGGSLGVQRPAAAGQHRQLRQHHGSATVAARFSSRDNVENHGTISAPGGTIGLAAGQTVELSERPDGRGMSMKVTLPQGAVNNYGTLVADAGTISLNAKVVNQNGVIQANSVARSKRRHRTRRVRPVNLGANSQILAQGDNSTGGSAGGNVTIQSGNNFSDTAGSQIVTRRRRERRQRRQRGNQRAECRVAQFNHGRHGAGGLDGRHVFARPGDIIGFCGTSTAGICGAIPALGLKQRRSPDSPASQLQASGRHHAAMRTRPGT